MGEQPADMTRLAVTLLVTYLIASAAQPAPDPVAIADAFVRRVAAESRIPGIAVGVVKQGRTVFAAGYGVQTRGKSTAVDADTLFQMGSCTKTFIAMGLAHFVASGSIGWDTTVHEITQGKFNASDAYLTEHLTIGDLLSHRSGYGDHDGDLLWAAGDAGTEADLVYERVKYLAPKASLRAKFMYSNIGFEIATVALEALAGEPWYTFVRRVFWDELGMHSTVAGLPGLTVALKPRLAGGHRAAIGPTYNSSTDQPIIDAYDLLDPLTPSLTGGIANQYLGAGSAISSVNDYCKWMARLLNLTAWLNQSAVIAQAQSAQMIVDPEFANFLMGFEVQQVGNALGAGFGFDLVGDLFHGQRFFTKGGGTLFHQTRTGLLPGPGLGAVVFANMASWPLLDLFVNGIRNAMLQIFGGESVSAVEADWSKVQATIAKHQAAMQKLPVETFSVPLQDDRNVSVTAKTTSAGPMLTVAQIEAIAIATDKYGLAPPGAANMTGVFHDNYYGTLEAQAQPDGRIRIHYGVVGCLLSALDAPTQGAAGHVHRLLCANGTAGLTSQSPAIFTYDSDAHTWGIEGVSVSFVDTARPLMAHKAPSASRVAWHSDAPKEFTLPRSAYLRFGGP